MPPAQTLSDQRRVDGFLREWADSLAGRFPHGIDFIAEANNELWDGPA